jgi:hypothetical protein
MMLVLPLVVVVTIVMPALDRSRLGLPRSRPGLGELHPCRGVDHRLLVRYGHQLSHGFGLVLHQCPVPAAIGEVSDGLFFTYSFARVA